MQCVEHYQQLVMHEDELLQNKNQQNASELSDYKRSIKVQIEPTLPPFYKAEDDAQSQKVIEPYADLEDYLDKDDFDNLLGVIGQVAGKTGEGLLSLGESILNSFVFKPKEPETQPKKPVRTYEPVTMDQSVRQPQPKKDKQTDFKQLIDSTASSAGKNIAKFSKHVFGGFFGQTVQKDSSSGSSSKDAG